MAINTFLFEKLQINKNEIIKYIGGSGVRTESIVFLSQKR